MQAEPQRAFRSTIAAWGVLALVLVLLAFLYRGVLDLAHVGLDTYPFLAAGRAESLGDLWRILTEEAMGGRYPWGHFYRPLTSLSFTLDQALWGIEARAYHRTDIGILLLSTALLFALARRLIGGLAGPLVALLVYALHTAHLSTVPVSARRVETLCVLFALAALVVVARPQPTRAARLGAAVLALCAIASKETGALVPLWIGALVWARWPQDVPGRLRGALQGTLPAALVIGLFVVARQLVLGGFGGHEESSLKGIVSTPLQLWRFGEALLIAQPLFGADVMGIAWTLAGLLLVAVALLPSTLSARTRGWAARPVLVLLLMLGSLSLLSAFSWRLSAWHVAAGLPTSALVLGIGARGAVTAWRSGRRWSRRAALAAAASLALLLTAEASISPLLHDYDEWRLMTIAQDHTLEQVRAAARELELGQSRDIGPLPRFMPRPAHGAGIEAAGLGFYSVQSFLELEFPGLVMRVIPLPEGRVLNEVPGERVLGVRSGAIGRQPGGAPPAR